MIADRCRPTEFLDYESPVVRDFVQAAVPDRERPAREVAVDLYYAVRDGIGYEIYGADLSRAGLRASEVIRRGRGLCIHKSIVYAACARACGIPTRLVLVDVRNHLTSASLLRLLGSDVFTHHCLASLELDGRWVKATPVFTAALCQLYGIAPLEFDGIEDSVFHPYDEVGQRHIEVVREHGEFDDLPYELVVGGLRAAHPNLFDGPTSFVRGSLAADACRPGERCS